MKNEIVPVEDEIVTLDKHLTKPKIKENHIWVVYMSLVWPHM